MRLRSLILRQGVATTLAFLVLAGLAVSASAQGFDKINTTVTNVNAILVTISIAVVTIAIIWAGFKMIFQGARLADVANVLIGGTLIGGAAAFATLHRQLIGTNVVQAEAIYKGATRPAMKMGIPLVPLVVLFGDRHAAHPLDRDARDVVDRAGRARRRSCRRWPGCAS